MKKVLSIFVISILVIVLSQINVYGATINANLSVGSEPTVGHNSTATVSFSKPVGTARFTLNYDSSKFQYVGSSLGEGEVSNSGSSLNVTYIRNDASTITSASFTFKGKAEGSGTFSVSVKKLSDADGNAIPGEEVAVSGSKSLKVNAPNNNSNSSGNSDNDSGNSGSPYARTSIKNNSKTNKNKDGQTENQEENTEENAEENKIEENKVDDELASLNLEPLEDDSDKKDDKKEDSQIVKFFKQFTNPENYTVPNIISIACTVVMLIIGIVQAIVIRKISNDGNGKRYE